MQVILVICGFCICKFAYLLKLSCDFRNQYAHNFRSHSLTCIEQPKSWVSQGTRSQLGSSEEMLCLPVSALVLSTSVLFTVCFVPCVFTFWCFVGGLSVDDPSQPCPSTGWKCCLGVVSRKAAMCLTEKICELDELLLGVILLLAWVQN